MYSLVFRCMKTKAPKIKQSLHTVRKQSQTTEKKKINVLEKKENFWKIIIKQAEVRTI